MHPQASTVPGPHGPGYHPQDAPDGGWPPPDPASRTVGQQAAGPPPPPATTSRGGPCRSWRDRLPEITATIGTVLVVSAITGFVTSTWDELTLLHRAVTMAAVAVGLTVAGVYAESASRRSLDRVVSLVYLSASVSVAASGTLLGLATDPGAGRLAIAAGGLLAAVHAGWVLLRDQASPTRALGVIAAVLYAAGPVGHSIADRFSTMDVLDLGLPLVGMADPTLTSDRFLIPGVAWAVIGVALLAAAVHLPDRTRRVAQTAATFVLFAAALMLNVLTDPVGAFAALCIVLGYAVYGWLADHAGMQVVGAVGVLIAGIRVLWGLFSGQLVITVAVLGVGLVLLVWSVRAARARADDTSAPDPRQPTSAGTEGRPAAKRPSPPGR
jgi:hypothetical protein